MLIHALLIAAKVLSPYLWSQMTSTNPRHISLLSLHTVYFLELGGTVIWLPPLLVRIEAYLCCVKFFVCCFIFYISLDFRLQADRAKGSCKLCHSAGITPGAWQTLSVFIGRGNIGLCGVCVLQANFLYPRRLLEIQAPVFIRYDMFNHVTEGCLPHQSEWFRRKWMNIETRSSPDFLIIITKAFL